MGKMLESSPTFLRKDAQKQDHTDLGKMLSGQKTVYYTIVIHIIFE